MPDAPAQRQYRAPCPGCGAPVEFRSAQSAYAICAYCHSTVVRQGEVLARIGKMAEVFDDHSPLQLGVAGRLAQDGAEQAFTLVGRLQYKSSVGTWTEWSAMLPDGALAWLSEDNGAYVFARPQSLPQALPPAAAFTVGGAATINGQRYAVAFSEQVVLVAAEGELPRMPALGQPFAVVELRGPDGTVLSLDYGGTPASASLGRAVRLEDLRLSGLRDASAHEEKSARQFACPHCGAPVEVALASTQSVTCGSCHSIIDLRSGIGGELRSALQDEPVRPLIALGSTGRMQGVPWQVVGFQHRMGQAPGDDEQFGWSEYLLYNLQSGFAFLVDSEEGWSLVRPVTGAPLVNEARGSAVYDGTAYQQQYAYAAETAYVEGEFYWPVERGQKTSNRDYAAGDKLLSMERTPTEITWSAGTRLPSGAVAQAFGLQDRQEMLQRSDVAPFSAAKGVSIVTIIVVLVVILILLALLSNCSGGAGGGGGNYRTSGGSFGGFSTGGGHK